MTATATTALATYLDLLFSLQPQAVNLYRAYSGPRTGQVVIAVGGTETRAFDDELPRLVMGSSEIWRRHNRGESAASIIALAETRRGR